jgi:hypothetical protein
MFEVGDKVVVLLPYWVQVHDDVEPYVQATILSVSEKTVRVEYDTPDYGKQSLVMFDLDCISKI